MNLAKEKKMLLTFLGMLLGLTGIAVMGVVMMGVPSVGGLPVGGLHLVHGQVERGRPDGGQVEELGVAAVDHQEGRVLGQLGRWA